MTQWYMILTDGAPPRQVQSLDGEDTEGKTVVPVARPGELHLETVDPASGEWRDDMIAIIAAAIAAVDIEREARQAALLTPGVAKGLMYAHKAREAAAWHAGQGAFDELTDAARAALFPAASAEAIATGDTIGVVLDRYAAARDDPALYRIEAAAMVAKAAIRSAETRAQVDDALGAWRG